MSPARAAAARADAAIAAGAALAFVAALTPWSPWYLSESLDTSFAYTLNLIAAQHLPLGTRVVSTFGPLGFLFYNAYYPATFAWLLGLRALLAALTGGTLAWLGGSSTGSRWGMVLLPLLCLPCCWIVDAWGFLAAALVLAVAVAPPAAGQRAAQLATGIALGILALVKITLLIAAIAVTLPLIALATRQRRRWWSVPAMALTLLVGWLACGQPLDAMPTFLLWAMRDISGGYARGMQMWAHHFLVLHAWGTAALLLAAAAVWWWPPLRAGSLLPLAGLAALLFLAFKAGYVRALDHLFITALAYQAIALVLASGLWRRRRAAALAVGIAPLLLTAHSMARESAAPLRAAMRLGTDNLFALQAFPRTDRAAAYAQSAAAVRARNPLPALDGRGDIYPHDAGVLLAYDAAYDPRPVFQSYMAYTAALAERNRAFLAGPDAPDWLLFRLSSIDSRLPSLDDGASWPELLSRYDLGATRGRYLQLTRRAQPTAWRLVPLGEAHMQIGERLDVPAAAAGPIWATISVRDRPSQRLWAAAIQGALVVLEVETAHGPRRRFRLIPSLAQAGFLLSPLIDTTQSFARFATQRPDVTGLSEVARIDVVIEPPALTDTFDPRIDVTFSRLEFTPWSANGAALTDPQAQGLVDLLRGLQPPEPLGGAALISIDDGREAVNAHTPAHFRVPLRPDVHELHFEFGLRDEVIHCSDGVDFRLSGRRGGQHTVLFDRLLVPRDHRADAGPQRATIEIPPGAYDALDVETLDNGTIDCDWAYIAALRGE